MGEEGGALKSRPAGRRRPQRAPIGAAQELAHLAGAASASPGAGGRGRNISAPLMRHQSPLSRLHRGRAALPGWGAGGGGQQYLGPLGVAKLARALTL